MKKVIIGLALMGIAAGFVPAQAADATGTVLLPVGTVSRLQRCQDVHGQNGIFGATINVVAGRAFTLRATGDNAAVQDLDIAFYAGPLLPCTETHASLGAFDVVGNEAGTVPAGANKAIIFLKVGASASFAYDES